MSQKKLITILATITIIAILSVSLFVTQFSAATATTYNADNITVNGVLASDSYVLFPFAKKNLKIGFSKYGEMIDGITDTGLAYDGYDAFAPPAGVVKWQWVEGWIINITYAQGGYYKNVWAMATYSDYYDSAGIGGPWHENVTCGSTGLAVRGGRKTSGGAVTEPIEVLYDGPRRFVALLNTTIYAEPAHDTPLVRITFTIVFDKVKKQVIIFKDIKRIDIGKNIWDMQIEFGDRGEWDLGASTKGAAPKSYAHIFENQSTVYNDDYQSWYNTTVGNYNGTYDVCQIIDDDLAYVGWAAFWPKPIVTWVGSTQLDADRPFILTSTSTKTEVHTLATGDDRENFTLIETPADYPQKNATGIFWKEDPMVFLNDHIKVVNGTTKSEMVWYFRGNNTVKFPAGYWPAVGDTVKIVYKHLTPHDDMSSEPASPFVVGEWAFRMYEASDMFRGVTVYGITDLNDGSDANEVLDTEVQYYLNETFNPYDLYSAVHKDTRRWVQFHKVTAAEVTAKRVSFNLTHTLVIKPDNWTEYCNFAEKVEWGGALRTPYRARGIFGGFNYTFTRYTNGVGNITITGLNVPAAGTMIKVLYSTNETKEKVDLITIEEETLSYRLTHWPVAPNTTRYGAKGVMVVNVTASEAPAIVKPDGYNMDTLANGTLKFTNTTGYKVYPGDEFKVIYEVWSGSYEWMVVGKDAATIDSIGAAYMTEAFDSKKDIEVLLTGLDINATVVGPYAPFVMGRAATGTKADYRDALGRTFLRDDWCTTYPVSSSNMLFSGGPRAQMGTEYFNEFTMAFFARSEYVTNDTGQANKILGLSCWNRTTYGAGYAVISVYKDLNGTIGFLIWGYDGQDTYYAAKWFWETGIEYLQTENRGVTDIILEIDYTTCPYSVSIANNERLGTISEKAQHDP